MQEPKPLLNGDTLTIVHVGGQRKQVSFAGLYGNKFDQAYVAWPMAGEYKLSLKTGKLSLKAVSLWTVCDEDLLRLRQASAAANRRSAENRKRNK
jgi:hypothetical protein